MGNEPLLSLPQDNSRREVTILQFGKRQLFDVNDLELRSIDFDFHVSCSSIIR